MTPDGLESLSERSDGEAFALHLSQRISHKPAVLCLRDEGRLWIIDTSASKMTLSRRERADIKPK